MVTRIVSGVAIAVIMAGALFLGGNVLFLLLLAASLIGLRELYKVHKIENSVLGIAGYACSLAYYLCVYFGYDKMLLIIISLSLILIMGAYVITYPKFKSEQAITSLFGIIYVAVMLSFIYRIRIMDNGIYAVWLVFICSWVADTCAYFVGVLFGKHKMAPKLSPKKSVEGAIGGVAGSMILGFAYGAIFNNLIIDVNAPLVFSVACGVGAVISIIGDLTASGIKREHEVKDYGKLIPGHGGILDRFDSVIFTAPAVYMVLFVFNMVSV